MGTLLQPVQSIGSTGVRQPQTAHMRSAWTLFLWWVVATCGVSVVLTLIVLGLAFAPVLSGEDPGEGALSPLVTYAIFAIPFLSVAGLIAGQNLVLKRYLDVARWVAVSTMGWIVSAVLIIFVNFKWVGDYMGGYGWWFIAFYPHEVKEAAQSGWGAAAAYAQPTLIMGLAAGAIGGLIVGAAQAFELEGRMPAYAWVIANVVGLGLGGALGLYIYGVLGIMKLAPGAADFWSVLSLALPTPASLLVVGIVTGAVVAWYSRRREPAGGQVGVKLA